MKRFYSLFLVLMLAAASLSAQQTVTQTYPYSGFTGIRASHTYSIEVTRGNRYEVILTAPEYLLSELEISCNDGVLVLGRKEIPVSRRFRSKTGNLRSDNTVSVRIQMPELKDLSLSGAADFIAYGSFRTDRFVCSVSGSSDLKRLDISGRELQYHFSGASDVQLSGEFDRAEGTISGSSDVLFRGNIRQLSGQISGAGGLTYEGNSDLVDLRNTGSSSTTLRGKTGKLSAITSGATDFHAEQFIADEIFVKSSGSSSAQVRVQRRVHAEASGAADISYKGNPTERIISTSGSSSVRRK